jgi:hypothetical protein
MARDNLPVTQQSHDKHWPADRTWTIQARWDRLQRMNRGHQLCLRDHADDEEDMSCDNVQVISGMNSSCVIHTDQIYET